MIICHNFSKDISGENFNFILCLELDILGKVYTTIPSCFGNERQAGRRVNTYFALTFSIYAFY